MGRADWGVPKAIRWSGGGLGLGAGRDGAGRDGAQRGRSDGRRLRKLCERKFKQLEVPDPFDLNEFCAVLGQERGRPVILVPIALPGRAPCGMWAVTDDADYIFVQRQTSPLHQALIGLHELSHLLFGHSGSTTVGAHVGQLLAPNLDPDAIRYMLGRTHYSADDEREAEMLATVILNDVGTWMAPEPARDLPPEVASLVQRLERSLIQRDVDRGV